MIKNKITITKDDIKEFSQNEINFIIDSIKRDFIPYQDEIKIFDIDNLIEYQVESEIQTSIDDDSFIKCRKSKSRVIFQSENNTYDLISNFHYQ